MRLSHRLFPLAVGFAAILSLSGQSYGKELAKHEAGRCSMRGQCGSESSFGKELPCPDNGLAEEPTKDARNKLVDVCGDKWKSGSVCCDEAQIDALQDNLKTANSFISSCPACKENFYNLFCTFTCSPDQSLFVNVTDVGKSQSDKEIVTELDNLWSTDYKSGFYDSCKEVKFGALGSKAMAFVGGGATSYTEFLAFLGKKSPLLGSPFQINFPNATNATEYEKQGMKAADPVSRACNDSDIRYRCTCVDCPASCPELPELHEEDSCHVGALPCLSFASVLIYSVFFLLLVTAVVGHLVYQKSKQRQSERLQLLQDAAPSDDEDEGDVVHNAGMLDRPQKNYRINSACDAAFAKLGGACARYPLFTFFNSVLIVILLSLGWINFQVETDPVRLWVSPSSAAAQEKEFFDSNFGPFYRVEQVFLVNDTNESGPGPVLSYDTLQWWFGVEDQIKRMKSLEGGVTLKDICFKPTGEDCVIQSVSGYYGKDVTEFKPSSWDKRLEKCTNAPTDPDCLPPFQLPLYKQLVLGGFEEDGSDLDSHAMVTTWVINNHAQGSEAELKAMQWESSLKDLLRSVEQSASERGLRLSFTTEISLEEELNKSSNTDAKIVAISYLVMFIYASFALGSASLSFRAFLSSPAAAMVQSKFTLGISGIIIVLMSVSASVGLFSAAGIKATLIIAEVIPFLVLAIGVDNIFLIVHEFERVNRSHPDEEIDVRMSKALGRMGPSILLSALTETVAFVLGVFVGMPAVRNFAAYAAGAVVINAILQVTLFIAVLSLNQRRVEDQRIDCFPFIRINNVSGYTRAGVSYGIQDDESVLQRFIRKSYAPALLNRQVKVIIVAMFLAIFAAGVGLIPMISLGLDQRIAIPDGSYLIQYFNDLQAYFNVGPPVYFVTRNVNVTARSHQQEVCGRFTTCNEFSLSTVLELESQRPDESYLIGATADWLDDFLYWLDPAVSSGCCKEGRKTCFEDREPPWNITLYGMPEGPEFVHYATKWLESPTTKDCPLGGKAPYSSAVVVDQDHTTIPASHFRSSHTPLRTQDDFIASYASARRIADGIGAAQGIDVFPYSKHYIFFDQYASIVRLTGALLGAAAALILALTSLLLGSLRTGVVVTLTVAMIVVDVAGTMAVAGISLNALSLVNLAICVGIGVEFCAHVARAFAFPSRTVMERARNKFRGRDARAWTALVNVGGSVLMGITVTKLLGVCVLAFTRSKIFDVYYFRVWLALVVWAALHALVFLPVALSLFGGEGEFGRPGPGAAGLADGLFRLCRSGE